MVVRTRKSLAIALFAVLCVLSFWVGQRAPRWFDGGLRREAAPAPLPERAARVRLLFQGAKPRGPLALALFRIRADRRYEAALERTVVAGHAELTLEPGRYWMVGHAPGVARFSDAFEIRSLGPMLDRAIVLEEPFRLAVEVRVRGEDEGLVPLPRATVLVERGLNSMKAESLVARAPFGALTDVEGAVAFTELPAPPFRVRVFARGYEPYDAEVSSNQLVVLRPVHVLRVQVKDGDRAMAGSIVEVSGLLSWPARRIETNTAGVAEILGLKAGRYALFAEAGELIGGPLMIDLASGVGIEEVTIELSAGLQVTATCRDQQGAPVLGAHVSFQPASPYDVPRYGETGDAGVVRLGPLRRAEGTLFVSAPGFVSRAVPVIDQLDMEIELLRGGTVVGRVEDSNGMPVSGAIVQIAGTDELGQPIMHSEDPGCARDSHFAWALGQASLVVPAGELGVTLGPVPPIPLMGRRDLGPCPTASSPRLDELVTDKDGRFAAYGVSPGTVVARAEHEVYLSGRSGEATLESEGTATLTITLGASDELIGRVLDFRDFPVPDAIVRILGRGSAREIRTQVDGTFRVGVAQADLTVRVFTPERPLAPSLEERVPRERPRTELTFRLPRPREATEVRVLDEEGHEVELVQVKLRSLDSKEPVLETRFTDARGRVVIARVRGLTARLAVSATGFAPLEVTRTLGEEVKLTLIRGVKAEGRVTSVRGRAPAPAASITLLCGGESFATVSGETGEYAFPNAPRGRCRLTAHHESLGSGEVEVQIQKTEHGRAFALPDLDLLAPEEYSGIVTNERGEPVLGALVSAVPLPAHLPKDSALLPEPIAVTNERGEFTLSLSPGQTTRLYAVLPARGSGASALQRPEGVRVPLSLVLRDEDRAPADLVATVLVGLEEKQGRLIVSALLPRDAETKNLRVGDVLFEIDREKPKDLADARELLSGAVGSEVRLLIERGGQELDVTARRETFRR